MKGASVKATAFNQDRERMKFTGHERDFASLTGAGDDLDYMHARHCSPTYQNIGQLTSRLQGFVNKLQSFQGSRYGGATVRSEEITKRVLELVIQRSALTVEQAKAIAELARKAQQSGVTIRVIAVY